MKISTTLALYSIQEDLDDSIFYKIAKANIAKEAWDILEVKYGVRGSNINGHQAQSKSFDEVFALVELTRVTKVAENIVWVAKDHKEIDEEDKFDDLEVIVEEEADIVEVKEVSQEMKYNDDKLERSTNASTM